MLNLARAAAFLAVIAVLATGALAQSKRFEYQYDSDHWRSIFTEDFDGAAGPLPTGGGTNWSSAATGFELTGTGYLHTPNELERAIHSYPVALPGATTDSEWLYEVRFRVYPDCQPSGSVSSGSARYCALLKDASVVNALPGGYADDPYSVSYRTDNRAGSTIVTFASGLARDQWYTIGIHRRADKKLDFYLDGAPVAEDYTPLNDALPGSLTLGSYTSLDPVKIHADFDHLYVSHKRVIPGDANLDGTVDISDFFILKTYFDEDPGVWEEGNFNDDSIVDISDFFILKAHFDESNPEPATIALLALGGLALLRRRHG